jgi:hypothetical protein
VDTKRAGERRLVPRSECMDCGQIGSAVELRSHAQREGCKNFRVRTKLLSMDGKLLDERVEVSQC